MGNRAQIVGVLDRCAAARGWVGGWMCRAAGMKATTGKVLKGSESQREREREQSAGETERERALGVSKTEEMSSSNPRTTFYYTRNTYNN